LIIDAGIGVDVTVVAAKWQEFSVALADGHRYR
jgi:hypothetical protein